MTHLFRLEHINTLQHHINRQLVLPAALPHKLPSSHPTTKGYSGLCLLLLSGCAAALPPKTTVTIQGFVCFFFPGVLLHYHLKLPSPFKALSASSFRVCCCTTTYNYRHHSRLCLLLLSGCAAALPPKTTVTIQGFVCFFFPGVLLHYHLQLPSPFKALSASSFRVCCCTTTYNHRHHSRLCLLLLSGCAAALPTTTTVTSTIILLRRSLPCHTKILIDIRPITSQLCLHLAHSRCSGISRYVHEVSTIESESCCTIVFSIKICHFTCTRSPSSSG